MKLAEWSSHSEVNIKWENCWFVEILRGRELVLPCRGWCIGEVYYKCVNKFIFVKVRFKEIRSVFLFFFIRILRVSWNYWGDWCHRYDWIDNRSYTYSIDSELDISWYLLIWRIILVWVPYLKVIHLCRSRWSRRHCQLITRKTKKRYIKAIYFTYKTDNFWATAIWKASWIFNIYKWTRVLIYLCCCGHC